MHRIRTIVRSARAACLLTAAMGLNAVAGDPPTSRGAGENPRKAGAAGAPSPRVAGRRGTLPVVARRARCRTKGIRMTASPKSAAFQWDDPLLLEDQLSADERAVRDAARAYCQDKLAPRVLEAFRNETADPGIFREMGALGLLGPTIGEAYGGAGLNYVCYGLIAREVERVDSLTFLNAKKDPICGQI